MSHPTLLKLHIQASQNSGIYCQQTRFVWGEKTDEVLSTVRCRRTRSVEASILNELRSDRNSRLWIVLNKLAV